MKTNKSKKLFISGNEAAVLGALDAGARLMFGYPITPASEILGTWIKEAQKNKGLQFLQTEDEIAAGFGVLGAVLGGVKAFTASAGPGHILMQDSLSMAENMRLPFVGVMMQRGGPSTGTVNFSQQEVSLAAFGGNGDGLRIVYSASSIEEMYELVKKGFDSAWRWKFPTLILGDGYLGKMKADILLNRKKSATIKSSPILKEGIISTNLRNCYSSERSLGEALRANIADWNKTKVKIAESETFMAAGAEILILAHGLVAAAAKEAVLELRQKNMKIGLWRPITLNPLDTQSLKRAVAGARRVYLFESSLNQFARIIKYELFGAEIDIKEITKPAEGFTPEEIIGLIK
ncbi:MAG TPA: transketolase C-terminal domain-containing protein [Candidatus Portnoybacteria bacterium]|nr:transketolase C-terminal domain-containing protein [Candidatus Portnoybacteria bacterium]